VINVFLGIKNYIKGYLLCIISALSLSMIQSNQEIKKISTTYDLIIHNFIDKIQTEYC
jgi:hypothetical protein